MACDETLNTRDGDCDRVSGTILLGCIEQDDITSGNRTDVERLSGTVRKGCDDHDRKQRKQNRD